MLNAQQLTDARKLCEAATKGPWPTSRKGWTDGGIQLQNHFVDVDPAGYGSWIAESNFPEGTPEGDQKAIDQQFFAESRTLLPALLDHIAAMEGEVKRLTPYKMYSCGRSFLAINKVAIAMQGESVRDPDVLRRAGKLGSCFPEKYPYRDETGNTWDEDTLDAAIELITGADAIASQAALSQNQNQ